MDAIEEYVRKLDAISQQYYGKNFKDLCRRRKRIVEARAWSE